MDNDQFERQHDGAGRADEYADAALSRLIFTLIVGDEPGPVRSILA